MEEQKITAAVTEEVAGEHASHGTNRGMKVAVAIDETEGSLNALAWALDHLIFLSNGNRLTLVHVQRPIQHFIFPSGPNTAVYATTSVIESIKSSQEQNTNALLATALKLCEEKGVQADTLIADGEPKEVICETAEQIHADLLVVGSRGLSKIKRAFLGSVSDYVAHHAKCPVLIVKPQK